jgi:Domain of unknown function (DUF4304)
MNVRQLSFAVSKALNPHGFVRDKSSWIRDRGECIDVVDLQKSKDGNAVTLNIGVLHRAVYRIAWCKDEKPIPLEPNCTVRSRIGFLMGPHDKWWEISNHSAPEDIAKAVEEFALPYLDRLADVAEMEKILVESGASNNKYPLPAIYLAVLMWLRGEHSGACQVLRQLSGRVSGGWRDNVDRVTRELNCSLH